MPANAAMLHGTGRPFVLIDAGARPARLYAEPVEIIRASNLAEVEPALDRVRGALAKGAHVAGLLTYEAGIALQPRLLPFLPPSLPLAWFGVFHAPELLSAAEVADALPDPGLARIGRPEPTIGADDYARDFERVRRWIAAGDIYQANLTLRARVPIEGDPTAAYAALRRRSQARHAALVHTGEDWILSLSPESFFELGQGRVTARPMKGTAPRHASPEDDAREALALARDPKQRAENLMIVDLLRNDLSRVARHGSVRVPELFTVETYPTVHQMTSTVEAELLAGADVVDVLRATFPCGSITGTPKLRAMEIIAALETEPRGAYCGAIGWAEPGGDAAFNVAIRTLHLPKGASTAVLGIGSGIVADSEAEAEWAECLTKARFVHSG